MQVLASDISDFPSLLRASFSLMLDLNFFFLALGVIGHGTHMSTHTCSNTHILGSYQSTPPRFAQTPSDTCTKKLAHDSFLKTNFHH